MSGSVEVRFRRLERAITQLVYYLERDIAKTEKKKSDKLAALHAVRDLLVPPESSRKEALNLRDLGDIKSKADWIVEKVEKYIMIGHANETIANIMTDSQMLSERSPEKDELMAVMVHAVANLIRGRIKVQQPWKERK